MTFPVDAPIGATYQNNPPTEQEIAAVRLAQSVLRQAGLEFDAGLLDTALSRPVFVHERQGWWTLNYEACDEGIVEARSL